MKPTVWMAAAFTMAGLAVSIPQERLMAQGTNRQAEESAAQMAADPWLLLVDNGRYGESWETAAANFQEAVTKAQWEQAVNNARRPFEPFGERTLFMAQYTTEVPNAPPGEYVIVQYQTEVSEGRKVVETVVLFKETGGWKVSGYFVRPN